MDEKMGQTYVWYEQANTLANRDYKQPQAVIMMEPLCMATGQANAEIMRGGCPTLTDNHEQPIIGTSIVRRLTPRVRTAPGFPGRLDGHWRVDRYEW